MEKIKISEKTFKEKILFFALSVIMSGIIFTTGASAATLTVDDSGGANFAKITDAINAASAGDTIMVYSGTYHEGVFVNKQLILQGVDNGGDKPVIETPYDINVHLYADGIILDGFKIINGKTVFMEDGTGIIINSNSNIIRNSIISGNEYAGITMYSRSNNSLYNNIISNNGRYGIYQYGGNDNKIYNNIFNNSENIIIWYSINKLDTVRTSGMNIIGGPYLGGNYWANPGNTGFSQTCVDSNLDGFCDSTYSIDASNTDNLPLKVMPSENELKDAYYFSDDFTDSVINSSKWNADIATNGSRWCSSTFENHLSNPGDWKNVEINPCNGNTQVSPYGSVTTGSGQISLSSGIGRTFPYIWSGPPSRQSPFPDTGDFILELRMKYDSIQPNGDGVQVLFWNNTDPVGNNPPIPSGQWVFGIWADSTGSPPEPLKFHEYRIEYIAGKYTSYFDGIPSWASTPSGIRANTIWIGNPVFAHWWSTGDWTDFTIDYVRVLVPDYTPPVTDISLSGTMGLNNWYTSDVQITLTAEDNPGGWGVSKTEYSLDGANWNTYSPPLMISKEGTTTLSYRSRDLAGNIESAKELDIKIDKTLPIIKGIITTGESELETIFSDNFSDNNYDGWTVYEGCLKASNGYLEKECTGSGNTIRTPVAVDADVINLSFDWKIERNLDSNCQGMAVNLERSPGDPVVSVSPDYCYPWNGIPMTQLILNINDIGYSKSIQLPRNNDWHNARLTIDNGIYTLYHDGVPVILTSGPELINTSWLSASGWTHWGMPGSGWDNFKVEVAPVASSINGWYDTDVKVKFLSFDEISGLESVTPDKVLSSEGAYQSALGIASDKAGNSASTMVSGINIDKSPPEISITLPADIAEYLLNQEVMADWLAVDHLSGIAWANGTASDGSHIDTGTVGSKDFTVNASDNVYNTAYKTVTYNVRYAYSGILEPINANGSSIFNSNKNSFIPVKFQLLDASGGFAASAMAEIYRTKINDNITGTINEDVYTHEATPGNRFIYNSSSNEYVFNLDSTELSVGTWRIEIRLDDETSKYVDLSIK